VAKYNPKGDVSGRLDLTFQIQATGSCATAPEGALTLEWKLNEEEY